MKKVIRCSYSNSTGKNFDKGQISERKVCLKRTNPHFCKLKSQANLNEKLKKQFDLLCHLNVPCPTTRIPRLPILNDLLSGKGKKQSVLWEKRCEKIARLFGQLGSPSRSGRQVAGILKKNMRSGEFKFCRTSDDFL